MSSATKGDSRLPAEGKPPLFETRHRNADKAIIEKRLGDEEPPALPPPSQMPMNSCELRLLCSEDRIARQPYQTE
jgi:hypothetical protein